LLFHATNLRSFGIKMHPLQQISPPSMPHSR
jgi:hypothetical protein